MIISVDMLKPGMIINEPVFDNGKILLCQSNTMLTPSVINRLKERGVKEVYIKDLDAKNKYAAWDTENIHTTIDNETKMQTILGLRLLSSNCTDQAIGIIKNFSKIIEKKVSKNPYDISYSLDDYSDQSISLNLYERSVRVALFSIALAKIYNEKVVSKIENVKERERKEINLDDISMAALFCDIGEIFKDIDKMTFLSYKTKINDELINAGIPQDILYHPYNERYKNIYAFNLIDSVPSMKNYMDVKKMILLSNQNETDVFANKISTSNESVNIAAKIIHLCDLYDKFLIYTIMNNTSGALENVIATLTQAVVSGKINSELATLFIQNIPIYSIGVRVQLSDGRYAIVSERTLGSVYRAVRPVVETVPSINGQNEEKLENGMVKIDLGNTLNLTISGIVGKGQKLSYLIESQLSTIGITKLENASSFRNR